MAENVKNNVPTTMTMTTVSAKAAIEYWLSNAVFQGDVKIEKINFSRDEGFEITFDRMVRKDG